MLNLEHLTKKRRGKAVLDDISLAIEGPRLISIIGPNGAGKSTLLGTITQLLAPDQGRILLDERPIASYGRRELAKRVSMLRQTAEVNLRLTVRELVAFGRFPYSGGHLDAADERLVDEAMARLSLTDFAGRYLDELSGGERQRAFIALVLAQDTDYILLDEPLNNLDMRHAVEIMKVLRALVDELGKTVLLVIHDINFASCYSDRIIAMREGRLVGFGPVEQMIETQMLRRVYDMDIPVSVEQGHRLCNYFV